MTSNNAVACFPLAILDLACWRLVIAKRASIANRERPRTFFQNVPVHILRTGKVCPSTEQRTILRWFGQVIGPVPDVYRTVSPSGSAPPQCGSVLADGTEVDEMERPAMQRPMMDPTFVPEPITAKPRPRWRSLLRPAMSFGRKFLRVLFYDPLSHARLPGRAPREVRSSWFNRFCHALLYRLAFVPVLVALTIAVLVYSGTHPTQYPSELDPSSEGIYYDPVTFLSEDGVRLEGWLVPVLEPKLVVSRKDAA